MTTKRSFIRSLVAAIATAPIVCKLASFKADESWRPQESGEQAFWRAVFADAAEPINPHVAHAILLKRCGFESTVENTAQARLNASIFAYLE